VLDVGEARRGGEAVGPALDDVGVDDPAEPAQAADQIVAVAGVGPGAV